MVDIDASLVGLLVHLHTTKGVPGFVDVFACILDDRLVDASVYFFSDISYDIFSTAFSGPTLMKTVELMPVMSSD